MEISGFALGALAQVDSVHPLDAFGCGLGIGRGRGLPDDLPNAGHRPFAHGIAQITVVPDAGEAIGKGVQKKTAVELGALKGEGFLPGGILGIAVAKADGLGTGDRSGFGRLRVCSKPPGSPGTPACLSGGASKAL